MATQLTYTTLLASMRRYIERGSAVDTEVYEQLPYLVNQAERQIAAELKILGFVEVVTGLFQAGLDTYQKPSDWLQTVSLEYGAGDENNRRVPIFARSKEYIRAYWPDATEVAAPEFYADYDYNHWLIGPTPDAAYPFELSYYRQLPLLDDVVQTNWLTDSAPNMLLYQALLQCAPFLGKDSRIETWTGMYTAAKSAVDIENIQRVVDRAATRKSA